jgi:hypothetical protein
MNTQAINDLPDKIFQFIVGRPKTVVAISLILMASAIVFLPKLAKDTRADAFLAPDNPALVYRNKVKEQFGLSDPLIIAIVNQGELGIFNPQSLALVDWLTEEVSRLDNVNSERVISLATENNIVGTDDGLDITPFFDPLPTSVEEARALEAAIKDFPLYQGSIVADDSKATLIVAEMFDEDLAESSYQEVMDIVARAPINNGEEIHVAGEGAVVGFFGAYVDADAKRLNPLAGLIITLVIIFAFRRISPAIVSNLIIAAAVLMTLGVMAASGVAFFIVTNALTVILIGIAVADSIHIYSHYFDLQAKQPDHDKKALVVATLRDMWRPVTLTSLTTMAGFFGLYFAADMPPFAYFGLFAALGVFFAWLYSLVFLPALLAITKPKASKAFLRNHQSAKMEFLSRIMLALGYLPRHYPRTLISIFALLFIGSGIATSQLRVDDNRIDAFNPKESIHRADQVINEYFNGSHVLDIVVETPATEDLFIPSNLQKIEALQDYVETLPHVQSSTSIVDYLKQMNRALNGGDSSEYRLPDSQELTAQYFLLYATSGSPTDFEEEIDYDYKTAIVRVNSNSGRFQDTKDIIRDLESYIASEFNSPQMQASLSGRVNLNYHWVKDIGFSHTLGVAISLLLVWSVSALLFRSSIAGLFTLIPVVFSILLVYATMVFKGIPLGIGTSMFASVAIGLGVDFAIHTIERLRTLYQGCNNNFDLALTAFYPTTGRALLFNFLALTCGFGVLISSQVVTLNTFGTIVVLAVSTSFLASMVLLPALLKVMQPAFFVGQQIAPATLDTGKGQLAGRTIAILVISLCGGYGLIHSKSVAADSITVDHIIEKVNNLDEGEFVSRELEIFLTDRSGRQRVWKTTGHRKYYGEERRTVLFYQEPSNVKGTAFMTWDYPDADKDDDQWLYLPALRKVRRISASERGDYFLGTDFTFQDINVQNELELADYNYTLLGEETIDGRATYKLQAIPKTEEIAKELGYGKTELWVDSEIWMVIKTEYWDLKNKPLKSLHVSDIRMVEGIWTSHQLNMVNHKTGHSTRFVFTNVDYQKPVNDNVFSQQALARGG